MAPAGSVGETDLAPNFQGSEYTETDNLRPREQLLTAQLYQGPELTGKEARCPGRKYTLAK